VSHFDARERLLDRRFVVRTMRTAIVAFGASLVALSPSVVNGQDAPPKLTIAAGGGIAVPFHADFDFTAPSWEVSVRGSIARHAAVEAFFEQWEHEKGSVFLDQAIQGPDGFIGRVARIEQRTTYRMRTAGANVLATGGSPRVSFFGGGGIGLLAYDRRFTSTTSGCDAATAQFCRSTANTFSSDSFTVQGVAEMDVAVVRRVQVFARYVIVVPVSDPGFGHGSVGGGVRLVLW
jgi:hypothetical protein